jgi:hypothetical protein
MSATNQIISLHLTGKALYACSQMVLFKGIQQKSTDKGNI